MSTLVEIFLKEKQYFQNISVPMLGLYKWSFKAFDGALDCREQIFERVGKLRERGVQAVTVNTYIRHINCYFRWLHIEHGKELVKIPKLKEEQKLLSVYSPEQILRIVNWKPVRSSEARLKAFCLTAIDGGLRINELLSLTRENGCAT